MSDVDTTDRLMAMLESARELNVRAQWQRAENAYVGLLRRLDRLPPAPSRRVHETWTTLRVRALLGLSTCVFARTGSLEDALEICDRASVAVGEGKVPSLSGAVLGQRSVLLHRGGRPKDALELATRALLTLDGTHHRDVGTVLLNRGNVHVELSRFDDALADYEAAHEHFSGLGHPVLVAIARHNIGWVRHVQGDLPGALQAMSEAASAAPEWDDGISMLGRAEVLFEAGLWEESEQVLAEAIPRLAASRYRLDRAEAEFYRARCLLGLRDFAEARRVAGIARRRFERAGHVPRAILARVLEHQAELTQVRAGLAPSRALARRRANEAIELAQRGALGGAVMGYDPGAAARIIAAHWAIVAGDHDEGSRVLAALPRTLRGAPLTLRLQHLAVLAELSFASGRREDGLRAVRRGFRLLAEHRSRLGTAESVAAAAVHGVQLHWVDRGAALASGSPAALFDAMERARATFAGPGRVTPPADAEAAELLTQARALLVQARELPENGAAREQREDLTRRARRLQERVRERSWRQSGDSAAVRAATAREVNAALRSSATGAVVANFVSSGGLVRAVRLDGARPELLTLGTTQEIAERVRRARADMDVLSNALIPVVMRSAASGSLARALDWLDETLIAPLRADGPLHLTVRDILLAIPWSALPSRRGLRTWVNSWVDHQPDSSRSPSDDVLVIAGPDLRASTEEAELVAAAWGEARLLVGADATCEKTLAALSSARIIHLAAHGTHESENPLFSSLRLADGPLFAYELDGVDLRGAIVVLSACEAGLSTVRIGGESLGLTSVLLRLGARAVIASVAALRDDVAARVMPALHAELRAGAKPGEALARAIVDEPDAVPLVCFGPLVIDAGQGHR
ncbi:CHAT domain-containing protein [Cellulosimicrobium sp. PMB13]|uniref:CHAT domain-containing protein n=1 Tax=Cellulosimicrobium sp. PMB13 TaxID=3120158 RepID=UPI003F4CA7BB